MSVKTKDELMTILRTALGENQSDEAIALVEDFSDTIDDMAARISSSGDWKTKYEENDRSWRQKYRDRFFNNSDEHNDNDDDDDVNNGGGRPLTFEELFKEE